MSDLNLPLSCEQFETHVSAYVDGELSIADRTVMEAHATQCPDCAGVLSEVRAIVSGAATLPPLTPSRDLWQGIEERLGTPVLSINTATTSTTGAPLKRARTVSFRVFAAAAAALVAVSSGATYVATRAATNPAVPVPNVATTAPNTAQSVAAVGPAASAPVATVSDAAPAPDRAAPAAERAEPSRTRNVSRVENSVELAYEREITAMRRIVDERLGDLDSVTVVEIERNLRIIDKAINDSRRALQNDPRSRFLSEQLDRALENKLGIMRRIALL